MRYLRNLRQVQREQVGPALFYAICGSLSFSMIALGPIGFIILAGQLLIVLIACGLLFVALYGWSVMSLEASQQFVDFQSRSLLTVAKMYVAIVGGLSGWISGGLLLEKFSGMFLIIYLP